MKRCDKWSHSLRKSLDASHSIMIDRRLGVECKFNLLVNLHQQRQHRRRVFGWIVSAIRHVATQSSFQFQVSNNKIVELMHFYYYCYFVGWLRLPATRRRKHDVEIWFRMPKRMKRNDFLLLFICDVCVRVEKQIALLHFLHFYSNNCVLLCSLHL